jgi:hypothetical protein
MSATMAPPATNIKVKVNNILLFHLYKTNKINIITLAKRLIKPWYEMVRKIKYENSTAIISTIVNLILLF